jgi:hypothetical protein
MNPEQRQLFEQLGRRPEFQQWLAAQEARWIGVLKQNTNIEQLCKAQGAIALVDEMRGLAGLNK